MPQQAQFQSPVSSVVASTNSSSAVTTNSCPSSLLSAETASAFVHQHQPPSFKPEGAAAPVFPRGLCPQNPLKPESSGLSYQSTKLDSLMDSTSMCKDGASSVLSNDPGGKRAGLMAKKDIISNRANICSLLCWLYFILGVLLLLFSYSF